MAESIQTRGARRKTDLAGKSSEFIQPRIAHRKSRAFDLPESARKGACTNSKCTRSTDEPSY